MNYDIPPDVLTDLPTLVFKDMVYSRLPFLAKTSNNDTVIANFLLEECYEMQVCFQIGLDPNTGITDWTKVGVESSYNVMQKSILADLVSLYIILLVTAASTQGDVQSDPPIPVPSVKFLSKAKAGSVDVEWKQLNMNETIGFFTSADGLLSKYKSSASRKARTYGCILDICDDCAVNLQLGNLMPFVTVSDCPGCGCK